MDPKITIVVPVYNVMRYLRECLDSILLQTYTNFELLLVDDGSTDDSGNICDEYEQQYSHVKVIHKSNGGVSSARNIGIDNAKGEWITFIDADDVIYQNLLADYVSSMEAEADMYIQGFEDSNGYRGLSKYTEWEGNDILIKLDSIRGTQLENFVWNKLYKISIIRKKGIRFNEDVEMIEDGLFNYNFILNARKVINLPVINYYYRRHGASACFKQHSYESWDALITSFNDLFDSLPPKYDNFIQESKNVFYGLSLDVVRSLFIEGESRNTRIDFLRSIKDKYKTVQSIKVHNRKGFNNKILTFLIMYLTPAVADCIIYSAKPFYKR